MSNLDTTKFPRRQESINLFEINPEHFRIFVIFILTEMRLITFKWNFLEKIRETIELALLYSEINIM